MTKAAMFRLHRQAGLVMALLLLVQGLTGAMLVWRGDIARLIDPAAMVRHSPAGEVTLSKAIAAAQATGLVARRIYAPERADGVYLAELVDLAGRPFYASIDPGDGQVLARGGVMRFPLEAALQLHYRLMLGGAGSALILLNGGVLLLLLYSGLRYWWPKRGRMGRSLTIQGDMPGRIQLRQFHRSLAVIFSIPVAMIAATGVLLAAPEVLEMGNKARPTVAPPLDRIDVALALAEGRFPGEPLRDVRLAADKVRVNFHAPAHGPRAVHQVTVDLDRMAVANVLAARDNPALWMTLLPIHSGEFAGLVGRLLASVAAFVLAALALSGPVMWWQQRSRRSAR